MSDIFFGTVVHALQTIPDLAIFLSLTMGYAIGQIRLGPIQLGGVCGTLIAALLIGQLHISVDTDLKNVFFMLFIFALGYSGGPQFFANLNARNIQLGIFCLIEVIAVLTLVLAATYFMHLDPGTAAGMMAGAATESAVVGTATDAISRLDLPITEIQRLQGNVVTAYSITYICGLITIVIVTSQIFPQLLRVNLRQEAEKLWIKMGGQSAADGVSALPTVVGRVYRVKNGAGHRVADIQQRLGQQSSIVQIQRHGRTLVLSPHLKLRQGDHVLLVGYRGSLIDAETTLGNEIPDSDLVSSALDTYHVVLLEPSMSNRALHELNLPAGAHVAAVKRGETILPALPETRLQLQDVLQIYDANPDRVRLPVSIFSTIGKLLPDKLASNLVKWMMGRMKPNQALFQLAEETGVILLPGKGFGTPHPSWRVSLANLNEYDYANIGKAIRKLAREYYEKFIAETGASEPPPAEKAAKVVSKEKAKSKKK
ncbi:aspartate-alanine antiporter [Pantoea sp. Taur]|uniref:aspartate-alanine antiporter-like transporter n=1 Tax=Pantoea sp. Taur TaxID=2576757 RepID=UPI001355F660|nr:aspartate-alanine antiporter [Pantoea sp. Taur]MXP57891.1 aspartate-alanine antiporter [Pantoea sp. Taur]